MWKQILPTSWTRPFWATTGFNNMKLRLRYMWESNAVSNWQNDALAPYTPSTNVTGAAGANSNAPVNNQHPALDGIQQPELQCASGCRVRRHAVVKPGQAALRRCLNEYLKFTGRSLPAGFFVGRASDCPSNAAIYQGFYSFVVVMLKL